MLKERTKKYIKAFNRKDLDKCAVFFSDDFALEDSVLKRVEGKVEVLNAIKGIFESCNTLDFNEKKISIKTIKQQLLSLN
jgi:ketosteroid isomerase-like protein